MRGRILRGPIGTTAGLVVVNGQQHTFLLEGVWRSDVAPSPDATVEVELDANGSVVGLTAVPESQLTMERAEEALQMVRGKAVMISSGLVRRFGIGTLVALSVVAFSWFFLTTVSYNAGFLGKMDFTLWKVLELINAGSAMDGLRRLSGDGGSTGMYGLLCLIALAGPLVSYFWKDQKAELGGMLPLLFMLFAFLAAKQALGSMAAPFGGIGEIQEIRHELMSGISIGLGTYLGIAASLFLAGKSAIRFLTWKQPKTTGAW